MLNGGASRLQKSEVVVVNCGVWYFDATRGSRSFKCSSFLTILINDLFSITVCCRSVLLVGTIVVPVQFVA